MSHTEDFIELAALRAENAKLREDVTEGHRIIGQCVDEMDQCAKMFQDDEGFMGALAAARDYLYTPDTAALSSRAPEANGESGEKLTELESMTIALCDSVLGYYYQGKTWEETRARLIKSAIFSHKSLKPAEEHKT